MQFAPAPIEKEATRNWSDQVRLEETIEHCLHNSGYPHLWPVACHCSAGTVVLTGRVPSFYMKQIAQTIAGKVDGVRRVNNLLEVADQDDRKEADSN